MELGPDAGLARWRDLTMVLRTKRRCIYLIGNGASASMASHFAADLAKNGRIHTEVFSDLSLITAISNDLGYEHVFAEPLRRRARAGDMLVAISSSGRSANILAATQVARERRMNVVTLTAMRKENPLRRAGTLNAWVPATRYGDAESCHAVVLHAWMDSVEMSSSQ
ncbi:MAG: SIS domain-containing protein [Vicinamibacterales bacterium]